MSLQKRLKQARSDKFVGREAQLDLFRRNITAKIPEYPFLQISGQGGVGKTTLLARFQMLCHTLSVPQALTNEEEKTVPQTMCRLAQLLDQAGHPLKSFTERYQTYLQLQEKIEKEPDRPDLLSHLFSRAVGKSAVVVGRATPVTSLALDLVGPDVVESQVSALSGYLFRKLKNKDEVRLVLEPTIELSPLFVADLSRVAGARQVVLIFDTFEDTGHTLLPWLLQLFEGRYGDVSEYISFVFAGRSFDAHNWLPVEPLLEHCSLEPFTAEETKTYLANKDVTDQDTVDQIYHLSGGLPVYVSMLAAPDTVGASQATRSVVERFLRNIEHPDRRRAALYLALTRRFDRDVLAVLLPDVQDVDNLFAWLIGMPFVQVRRDYWQYHPLVRQQMIAYQRNQSRNEFEQLHRSLADYYNRQLVKRGGQAPDCWQRYVTWWPDYLEATYHALCAGPHKKLPQTQIELAELFFNRGFGAATVEWAVTLNQAADDLGEYQPLARWAGLILRVLGAVASEEPEQEIKSIFKLFDILCRSVNVEETPLVGSMMYLSRGNTYYKQGEYERAIADYDQAIELNPEYAAAYSNRGNTYSKQGEYERAIADYDQAIELNPEYAAAYYNTACAYALQENIEAALPPLRRALELDPANHLNLIPADADFDALRDDSRFQALLAGFSQDSH